MEASIYIRLRHRVLMNPGGSVRLEDIAQVIGDEQILPALKRLRLYEADPKDRNIVIIDAIHVIEKITEKWPTADVQMIGPNQTIIEIVYHRKKVSWPLLVLVWLLLFIGSALTIMNFHEDVSMKEVHLQIYELMTGQKIQQPLIFQIPYSIGLGAGMILFFNHVFKKRLNDEPSPLEVEMFNYQMDLDQYVIMHENKESVKLLDGD
ncbi:MAG TPA: stage V sporulation protein AA [Chondromyces sp.]|nr:stage V sporulation protein AA [Chondromyces sp.]